MIGVKPYSITISINHFGKLKIANLPKIKVFVLLRLLKSTKIVNKKLLLSINQKNCEKRKTKGLQIARDLRGLKILKESSYRLTLMCKFTKNLNNFAECQDYKLTKYLFLSQLLCFSISMMTIFHVQKPIITLISTQPVSIGNEKL